MTQIIDLAFELYVGQTADAIHSKGTFTFVLTNPLVARVEIDSKNPQQYTVKGLRRGETYVTMILDDQSGADTYKIVVRDPLVEPMVQLSDIGVGQENYCIHNAGPFRADVSNPAIIEVIKEEGQVYKIVGLAPGEVTLTLTLLDGSRVDNYLVAVR